ncbi:MAG: DsrE family protein [Armatimonadetes bacterium]|nr:DsrE family protein [Armatimonadota bacterium]
MIRGDFSELEETQALKIKGPGAQKNIVILVKSESLGSDEILGKNLMNSFLQSLINNHIKPKAIIFTNQAVKLALNDSPNLGKLLILEEQGIKVLICEQSVSYYQISKLLKVGSLTDMETISEHLLSAWKVITV